MGAILIIFGIRLDIETIVGACDTVGSEDSGNNNGSNSSVKGARNKDNWIANCSKFTVPNMGKTA